MDKMIAEAERLGKEMTELDERNRRRRAKGRKPILDAQEKKDLELSRKRYRVNDATTVDGADALKLFEMRKNNMIDSGEVDIEDDAPDADELEMRNEERKAGESVVKEFAKNLTPKELTEIIGSIMDNAPKDAIGEAADKAIREAEAARRVQDLKNGRIDHEGNWSVEGQKLDGGDETRLPQQHDNGEINKELNETVSFKDFGEFASDLYRRLGTSFDAIERTLSDLQGRISEIVTASTPPVEHEKDGEGERNEFEDLLSKKTPVTFNVGGTTMSFDAITVFHAPPCITVVSKIGSAKITPKPGARLKLSYEMDGITYHSDPVTYLGTRFDLPMFNLSFVGFIRDSEADSLDADAVENDA